MINMGALAEYSQVEMLVRALPTDSRAKAVMQLELDPRDPSTFKYNISYSISTTNVRLPRPLLSWIRKEHIWHCDALFTQSQFEFHGSRCQ
jgi:hypothetical protein